MRETDAPERSGQPIARSRAGARLARTLQLGLGSAVLLAHTTGFAAEPSRFPERAPGSPTGAEFIGRIAAVGRHERERAILTELQHGNFPDFLRRLVALRLEATDDAGAKLRATVRVMPDVLAIGSDQDFVRMPMTAATAQAFCDAWGLAMPTPRIVEAVWRQAGRRLWPQPLVDAREAPSTFLWHHRIIEEQLDGTRLGTLIAGHKKDIVVTKRLVETPARVAIFGWHKPTGEPIQPLSLVHGATYVDYSHGVRPLARQVEIDNRLLDYEDVLRDPRLHALLSDEGPIEKARYDAGR